MSEPQPRNSDVLAAVQAGLASAGIELRSDEYYGVPYVLREGAQHVEVLHDVLAAHDARQPAPRRRRGTATITEQPSFCDHVNRFKSEHSVIFADVKEVRLVAIYDYHPGGSDPAIAAWCQHRAVYACPLAEEWVRWRHGADTWLAQDDFAEFIDANFDNLTSGDGYPVPIDVMTMARDLRVHQKGTFERTVNPTTGDHALICKLETDEKTSTKIPRAFLLALPVFLGGSLYKVEARVRMRLRSGAAQFSYTLYRAEEIHRDAFGDVRAAVAEATGLPVLAGSPE